MFTFKETTTGLHITDDYVAKPGFDRYHFMVRQTLADGGMVDTWGWLPNGFDHDNQFKVMNRILEHNPLVSNIDVWDTQENKVVLCVARSKPS